MFIYIYMMHLRVNCNPPAVITTVLYLSSLFAQTIKVCYAKIRNNKVGSFFLCTCVVWLAVDYSTVS